VLPEILDEFKKFIGVEGTDEDDTLLMFLELSEAFIFEHYGVAITERTISESLLPVHGSNKLYTSKGLISEVTALSSGGTDYLSDITLIKPVYVFVDAYLTDTVFVDIEYKVGWSVFDDIPKGLLSALFTIAKKEYNDARKDLDTLSSVTLDIKQGIRIIDDIPPIAASMLNSYRVFRL